MIEVVKVQTIHVLTVSRILRVYGSRSSVGERTCAIKSIVN